MPERVETDAIVIQRFAYGESSQIAHLLTPDLGRVAVMARGAWRAKNGYEGPLDLLVRGRVKLQLVAGRELGLLLERRVETAYPALRRERFRHAGALHVLRRVLHFEPVGGGAGAFALLDRALRALETVEERRLPLLLLAFDLRLAAEHGLKPDVAQCVRCGSPRRLARFVAAEGGVVCADCVDRAEEGDAIDARTAELIAALLSSPLRDVATPAPATLARARRLVDRHLEWHADAAAGPARPAPRRAAPRRERRVRGG
jgi:DNA repair protein RecO (recombination protein O)